jgi:NhaA family Na+:H+ antiporter
MTDPVTRPIERALEPLRDFLRSNAAGGLLLLAAAVIALVWSNTPFGSTYDDLWSSRLTVGLADIGLSMTLHDWINDGLMAVFFLVVGLEIKRELLVGELASRRRATLPAAAALGGAVLPAIIFLGVVGPAGPAANGWGVPMATDIAFALGALALLGRRIPLGLRIFVAALAIVDDLLAVLVIALFYTAGLSLPALAAAAIVLGVLVAANRLGIRRAIVYVLLGVALWVAVLESGIHATVAGVLLAATIPAGRRGRTNDPDESSPMVRIEHSLTPVATYLIVPLFALANAGVALGANLAEAVGQQLVVGIIAGLVIGKPLGIIGGAWLVVRSGLATLPVGVRWAHVYGAAWLCGIGFTMSLFIADLAFGASESLALAKIGILIASSIAAVGGYGLLRWVAPRRFQVR